MAPKIEVLDDIPISKPHQLKSSVGGTKKNPFATAKVKTERVDPKSIKDTSYRKGLNKPEFVRNSPLDLLFHELESKIMHFPLDELSLEKLYQQTNTHSNIDLIEVLTNYLIKIQDLSIAAKKRKQTDAETGSNEAHSSQDLISISLHDIRTFSRLVNLIIIHGVYPALESNKIGIPFAQRRLNDFSKLVTGNKKSISIDQIRDTEKKEKMLLLLFEKFFTVFSKNSSTGGDDVKDLLLRGTGYSDFLTITSALLTVHSISTESRDKVRLLYPQIISFPDTFELFQTFSLLMSSPSPNFFKQFVSLQIQTLHVMAPRGDGILTLIEFVLGLRENEEVNIEKFDHVANVILAKPKSINTVEYFTRVGNQIYTLLININKTVVNSCVCYVLEKLWLRNQLIVKDFVLKKLWKNFDPSVEAHDNNNKYSVSEADLNNNTNVIISLTKNNPSSSLLYAAFNCVLVYIWSYYLFLKKSNKSIGILKGVLVSYFSIRKHQQFENMNDFDTQSVFGLDTIVKNLLCDGGNEWTYRIGENQMVEIIPRDSTTAFTRSKESKINSFLKDLDIAIELFIELLSDLDDDFVHMEFICIFKRWLFSPEKISNVIGEKDGINPFFMLIDLRLLESIGDKFKDNLGRSPLEMLEIVDNFLDAPSDVKMENADEVDSDDEDDAVEDNVSESTLPILLQLLSAILSESSTADLNEACFNLLKEIKRKLLSISSKQPSDIATPAKALHDRIVELLEGDKFPPKTVHEQNVKILKLAITSLNDPLVPIRAHGLHLLRQLVESKCEDVISLDFVIELHLNQLKDPEPFIYLNVIKGLLQLINWNENEVIPRYVNLYINSTNSKDSTLELDERLRIGEVLLRYIQESNELFAGENAMKVVEGALSLIRRDSLKEPIDNRLRSSAMSILGVCCRTNPLGMVNDVGNALDCAIGILKLETTKDEAVMRRAAIVLIHDLIIGTSNSPSLPFPEEYRNEAWNILKYVYTTDNDLLVREQAKAVLDTIDELVKLAYEDDNSTANEKYKKLQIL